MIDALFLSAVISIGTACVLSYLLGRHHGLEIGLTERFGPMTLRHDEAPGDCFPTENALSHFGTNNGKA